MSATNATTNYALPLFIGTDKPAWLVDWNGAMTAIDAAIKGVDTDVQGAITSISGLSSTVASHTSSISTITGQLTVITTNLNTATGNINTINSLIGNGTPTTTDQTLIGAINELHANQGDLDDLTTPAASLVAAINAISAGGAVAASAVSFDNTGTSLAATDVQAAIVELSQGGGVAASAVSYNNAVSGLTATDVQSAIDELAQNSTVESDTYPAPNSSGNVYVRKDGNIIALTVSIDMNTTTNWTTVATIAEKYRPNIPTALGSAVIGMAANSAASSSPVLVQISNAGEVQVASTTALTGAKIRGTITFIIE